MSTVDGHPAFSLYTAKPTSWKSESHDRLVASVEGLVRTSNWLEHFTDENFNFDGHRRGDRSPTDIMMKIKFDNNVLRRLLAETTFLMNKAEMRTTMSYSKKDGAAYVVMYRLEHLASFLQILGVPAQRIVDKMAGSVLIRIKTDATKYSRPLLAPEHSA